MYRTSGGVPRLVNILCHKSLMCAFGKGDKRIERAHVMAAVRDTEGVDAPRWWSRWVAAMLPLLALVPVAKLPVPV